MLSHFLIASELLLQFNSFNELGLDSSFLSQFHEEEEVSLVKWISLEPQLSVLITYLEGLESDFNCRFEFEFLISGIISDEILSEHASDLLLISSSISKGWSFGLSTNGYLVLSSTLNEDTYSSTGRSNSFSDLFLDYLSVGAQATTDIREILEGISIQNLAHEEPVFQELVSSATPLEQAFLGSRESQMAIMAVDPGLVANRRMAVDPGLVANRRMAVDPGLVANRRMAMMRGVEATQ